MNEDQYKTLVTVQNAQGLHMRPAQALAELTTPYEGQVTLMYGMEPADAKSMMQVILLAVGHGNQAELQVTGPEAETFGKKVEKAFKEAFGLED